jgi:hypothetical protein
MRKIISSTVAAALIGASASQARVAQAFAAQARHPVRKETAASEQIRNGRNAAEQPSQPGWQYSGWSAPAGR